MASLEPIKGVKPGERVELKAEKLVVGRDPTACQLVIDKISVSRTHAQIRREGRRYYITDLDSRNHTFVNDQRLASTPVELHDNDRITICDVVYAFRNPPLPPLPPDLRPEEPEPPDDVVGSSTVEASVSSIGSRILLETQPADKLKALLDISASLSNTLDLDSLLPKILDSLFQLFKQADRGFIILRDETNGRLIPKAIRTRRSQDDGSATFSRRIVNQVIENVQAILSEDASKDFPMSQSIADFRIRSAMCAPLWSQAGTAFGAIHLDTQDRSKKFTQDDLKLLMGVAGQASVALENARLHGEVVARERLKRDLELAREVQRSFLPRRPPDVPGYEFFAHYEAALQVGGDYFDFVPLSGGRVAVMLGDVAGKGVPAALLMAKLSAEARFCMLTDTGPAGAVTRLNHQMHEAGLTERFVTLVAAVVDPNDHSVTVVNAGHPSPLVFRAGAEAPEEAVPIEAAGLPIGILDGFDYTARRVTLEPGDALLIFSDGVTEAMDVNEKQLKLSGVCAALRGGRWSPREMGDRLVKAIRQHAAGRNPHDDVTLVCFGRTAVPAPAVEAGAAPTVPVMAMVESGEFQGGDGT